MMSDRSAQNSSGEKIPFDPEHRNSIASNEGQNSKQ